MTTTLLRSASALVLAAALAACEIPADDAAAPVDAVEPAAPVETAAAPEPASVDDAVWPFDVSDLTPDPTVTFGVLDNGVRYIIRENDLPSGEAALRVRMDAGALDEEDDQQGLAHFLEHMAFNGSENYPEGELTKTLERFGLSFGGDTNAYVSFDETVYLLDLPETDPETLDVGLKIMRDQVSRLLLEPDAVERERGVIMAEMRDRNSYQIRFIRAQFDFAFPDARFPNRFPIGTAEVVENTTAQRIRDFYEVHYRPENTLVVAVGDFDGADIERRITKVFGDWEPIREDQDVDLGTMTDISGKVGTFVDPDMPTVVQLWATRAVDERPDSAATRRDETIRSLATSALNRRFARIARQEDAPFSSASTGDSEYFDIAQVAQLEATATSPDAWDDALIAIENELRRALIHGFSDAEAAERVAVVRASLEQAVEQEPTRQSAPRASGLMNAIASDRVPTTPQSALDRFESFAGEIDGATLTNALRAMWGEDLPAAFVGAPVAIEGGEEAIRAALETAASQEVSPPEDAGGGVFAYTDWGQPGDIVERADVEDLDIARAEFANGVRASVKQTDFEQGRIRVSVRLPGGTVALPKDLPGLNTFATGVFTTGGLGQHTADELQSLLAGRQVTYGFNVGQDAYVLSGTATPQDFDLLLQLLTAFVADAGYRTEAQAQFRRVVAGIYATIDTSAAGVDAQQVARALRSDDPRFGLADREDLDARTMDELQAELTPVFASAPIEIGIVGDIAPEAALASLAATFGTLPDRGEGPAEPDGARDLAVTDEDTLSFTHRGEPNQARFIAAWPLTDNSDADEVAVLTMLRAVARLKVIDIVREREGAAYSPSVSSTLSSVFPGFGLFRITIDTPPETFEGTGAIVAEIREVLSSEGGVTEDEVTRAREPLLQNIEENLEQNGYWAGLVGEAWSDEEALERHRTATARYGAVTAQALTAAAQQYLTADAQVTVTITPDPSVTASE